MTLKQIAYCLAVSMCLVVAPANASEKAPPSMSEGA